MNLRQIFAKVYASHVYFPGNITLLDAMDVAGGIPLLGDNGKIQQKNLPSGLALPTEVTITDTAVTLAMQPNTTYICTNPISSLTLTSIPESTVGCSIVFTPTYGNGAQQDLLCPITLPTGKKLINFIEEDYTYNAKVVICILNGLAVFGQEH
ncbi:MAG: hypothetical protein J6M59_10565 [Bacteroidaceae bacterium]|nr:hypothetical protein [Bacteroidaceae bacterium]